MIILGIDPGVARLGYGAIEFRGEKIIASAFGCIETSKIKQQSERLLTVRDGLRELFVKYRPMAVAVEKLFFAKNVKTAGVVGEARGVILATVAELGLPIVELTPLEVKQSVTGYGAADKRQVQEMVRRLLRLDEIPKPDDAADALAIALTGIRFLTAARLRGGTPRG